MRVLDFILGQHLADSETENQRVGVFGGIPMLGLDALSSSAYGTEAALTILLPLGAFGLSYIVPITAIIIALLFIVFISYRQTIHAYPNGGGSYTVAHENLGLLPGLLAAAALMLDYVLTVAVGIAAGVGALISAVPMLQSHILSLCLIILVLITIINLRGVKESGAVFSLPTYLFITSLLGVLAFGVFKALMSGGHPVAVEAMPLPGALVTPVTAWLLLRAFASGCTAMTGVEAVSNGVSSFRQPVIKNAQRTLTTIILVLILMLAAIGYLAKAYGLAATDPLAPGFESLISQLVRAIVGKGVFYYITIGSTITVLALSANTAFADFPRLCQILAKDNFLPHTLAERGRRLVYSTGIIFLAIVCGLILVAFGGVTDRLIPLFAIGAFLAFTLSQAGMVVHWTKLGAKENWLRLMINAVGAVATGITLIVVLVSKFTEGGWISASIVTVLILLFFSIRRHYKAVGEEIGTDEPLSMTHLQAPIVVVPFRGWSKITRKAMGYALQLSEEVYAVHVLQETYPIDIDAQWERFVVSPAIEAGIRIPKLVKLPSPYRKLFGSFLEFLDELEEQNPGRHVAIIMPNLAESKWYHYFLHNQRAVLLNTVLFLRRDPKLILVTVPWYLKG